MKYGIDTTGVEENKGFALLPEAAYDFVIAEKSDKETQGGDPMVNIKLVVDAGQYAGAPVWDNIVIPRAGSPAFKIMGRTKHFLHMIGEPYEGKFTADSDKWVWKKVRARVAHKLQEKGKNAGKMQAVIAEYLEKDGGEPTGAVSKEDEEVPF